eukprot:14085169-Heterocapsa_arctica.AAC.1
MAIMLINCRHFGPSILTQQLGGWKQDHGKGCATICTTTEEEKRAGERYGQRRRQRRERHVRLSRWLRCDDGREEQDMGTTDWSTSDLYRTAGVLCESQSEYIYLHCGMQQWSRRVDNLQESQLLPMQQHRQGGNEDRDPFGK